MWKEWELRLLVLFSLFLQLTLATQASRRKSIFKNWIQVVVWTTYLLADYIATLTLGIMSNRLANLEKKGTIDPKTQIRAFWAPFLLLHLGGPDTISSYALADNELWLRHLVRLCGQVGLACYIYVLALMGSTLWILAAGMNLVGLIKYAERPWSLYLASVGRLQDSMISRPNFGPFYHRKMAQYTLKKEEGYRVGVEELTQIPALEDLSVEDYLAHDEGDSTTLDIAYESFKIFKLLFMGLTVNSIDLHASKSMFTVMNSMRAFKIVEIELGFMYDLLYTKVQLLYCAWGIIRWVISLSVPCAVLVSFSLQDKKDYPKVDIWITFLLIIVAIFLEIFSLLLAISSDWVNHWLIQRPRASTILSNITFRSFSRSQRWSNSVAQISLLDSSIRNRNSIFRYPRLAKLGKHVEKNFYIDYKELDEDIKDQIFQHMKDVVNKMETLIGLNGGLASHKLEASELLKNSNYGGLAILKLEASELLKKSNCDHLKWSLEAMEFDQSIIIWHIATELCHYEDCRSMDPEDVANYTMSMLVSRYMIYLLRFYPSMLGTGIGVLRYEDTLVEAQKFFEDELAMLPKKEGSISWVVIQWAQKLFEKEAHVHTRLCNCFDKHDSRESRDLCEVCYLLLQVRTKLPAWKMRGPESTSVLFDACRLARQLKSVERWKVISKVWVRMMMYAACQCKGYEHSESPSRGGELLSHVWLLTAHLGVTQPVQTSGAPCITKLIIK
ncbi:uncharacterized protein LOC104423940 [Eucalyptus grandis]|uniref:uncharacterized protein LOC104423940 n=1 Tax=Eucalyptus grandis TaxID=71139 RepID=UPI00192EB318|nr:uncharacterized protein LOC104423940 [Eucalyptus grandis]